MKRLNYIIALVCGLGSLSCVWPICLEDISYVKAQVGGAGENLFKSKSWMGPGYELSAKNQMGPQGSVALGFEAISGNFLEVEVMALRDTLRIKNKALRHRSHRQAVAGLINIGGHLDEMKGLVPFVSVGSGVTYRSDHASSRGWRLTFQWITGVEKDLSSGLIGVAQHRYRKSWRSEAIHSVEAGIKYRI